MTWFKTGTVTATNGSAVVTGAGSPGWLANAQAGLAFRGPDGLTYEIASVDSNTQITLATLYQGPNASGAAYAIVPLSGFVQTTLQLVQQFLTTYGGYATTSLTGKLPAGSVAAPGQSFAGDQDTGFYLIAANLFGLATGGVARAEYGASTALFADPATGLTLDLVGRAGDSASGMRLLDASRSVILGMVSYNPAFGLDLNSPAGATRVAANSQLFLTVGGVNKLQLSGNYVLPSTDNLISLGSASNRLAQAFVASGQISTSDERVKTWRGDLTGDELAAAKEITGTIGIYQMNDAIADKGKDKARWHTGVKAQKVVSIMIAHGLDPLRYGFVCHDSWDAVAAIPETPATPARAAVYDAKGELVTPADPGAPPSPGVDGRTAGDLYGIRYDELAMFLLAAQEQRLAAVETKLAA